MIWTIDAVLHGFSCDSETNNKDELLRADGQLGTGGGCAALSHVKDSENYKLSISAVHLGNCIVNSLVHTVIIDYP